VLLFEAETEWFHTSNPIADRVLRERAGRWGWDVVATKDPSVFTVETLASFDAVVFLLTSGTVLNAAQRDAFHAYIAAGGGWAGVHSASHTDYDSPWQIGLVGSTFSGHPAIQPGVVVRTAGNDAIVDHVPPRWERTDEWYSFVWPPEKTANLEVLLALDEGAMPAYPGPGAADSLKMGFHPITWKLEYGGGRSFYTAMGHTDESYSDETFLELLHRGFEWAGGRRLSTRKGALVSATPRLR
jgi:type 1 glutamine amidotransferase